uniref:Uncharacterized protein n=1 Tax=Anguilla anguilla TaxID=7936 RepID=A0A0E9UVI2_ANGAN
MRGRVETVRV